MSSVTIPMPKSAGGRPPFVGPPSTTFDSRPEESGEPLHRRIAESVDQVLKACRHATPDTVPMLKRLIVQRRQFVERELTMFRMISPATLPPPFLGSFYGIDFATEEGEIERLYVRLSNALQEASERLDRIVSDRNG